ncbi:MAG: hypothetical protein QF781_01995, partial [Phycisphaerales bacterium]|nr:hypothetical protein [Phycisphaerales bacterium]
MSVFGTIVLVAAMADPAVGAPLSIEKVAPSNAVGVVSVTGLDAVLSRLTESELLNSDDREALNEEIRGAFNQDESSIGDVWKTLLEDHDPLEVVSSISGGFVLWVEPSEDSGGQLTM